MRTMLERNLTRIREQPQAATGVTIHDLSGTLHELVAKFWKDDFENHGPASSSTFAKFLDLPVELRTMIWEYALPQHRTFQGFRAVNGSSRISQASPNAISDLRATCVESCQIVMKRYMAFETEQRAYEVCGKHDGYLNTDLKLFLDPNRDCLYLDHRCISIGAERLEIYPYVLIRFPLIFPFLKTIAISQVMFDLWFCQYLDHSSRTWLRKLKNLQKIVVVVVQDTKNSFDLRPFKSPPSFVHSPDGNPADPYQWTLSADEWSECLSRNPELCHLKDVQLVFVQRERQCSDLDSCLSTRINIALLEASASNLHTFLQRLTMVSQECFPNDPEMWGVAT